MPMSFRLRFRAAQMTAARKAMGAAIRRIVGIFVRAGVEAGVIFEVSVDAGVDTVADTASAEKVTAGGSLEVGSYTDVATGNTLVS